MARPIRSRYLPIFRQDLKLTLTWSQDHFGSDAAARYGALIRAALRDLLSDPLRPGVKTRSELAPNAFTYHLIFSRDRVVGERVKEPRHFILFRYADPQIEFARLLHDSRELSLHLPYNHRP